MQIIYKTALTALFLCLSIVLLSGQNTAPGLPQRSATVMATQAMHFGDITVVQGSSGGTVTVDHNGMRSATGNVLLLNMGNIPRQAIFEFKLCPGRIVSFNFPPFINLTGQNGGTIKLELGQTNYGTNGSTFISNKGCDDIHLIHLGGTIEVNDISTHPGGLYTGTFNITFIQQ